LYIQVRNHVEIYGFENTHTPKRTPTHTPTHTQMSHTENKTKQ